MKEAGKDFSISIRIGVAPRGRLAFDYHKPFAGLERALDRRFTRKTQWGYYGYNEKTPSDPATALRDFRGNLVSLVVNYSF